MDAARVKEIVDKAIDSIGGYGWISRMPAGMSMTDYFKEVIKNAIAEAEAAEAEAAEDSEPDTERNRHWQERAGHLEGRLDPHDSLTEDEANSIRFMQVRDRIADIDTAFSDTLKGYLKRLEKVEYNLGGLDRDHDDLRDDLRRHYIKHTGIDFKQADEQLDITIEKEG